MDSRIEEVLNILLSGDIASFEPLSRNEQYLKACCNKTGTDGLPIPMSRIEALLYRLADEFPNSGGSDLSDATATAEDIRKDKVAYGASGKIIGTAGASLKDFIKVRGGCKYLFYESTMITVGDLITFEDTSSVTDTYGMFSNCSSLTTVPLFDTSSVTNMANMFSNCSSLTTVPLLDTSSVTNMTYMFYNCSSLTTVPLFNTRLVTNMSYMFQQCSSLTTVPLFDTSSGPNMVYMFGNCSSLTTVPLFDTSSVTNMYNMFYNCSSLATVPLFDTSSVPNMSSMFYNCSSLATVPLFDTSSVTNMSNMFYNCSSLTTVPLFDTSSVTNMSSMFQNCSSLTTVPSFDTRSVTNMTNMFNNCKNLTECWIRNIKSNLQVGSSTSYGHLLTLESLEHLIQELRNIGASRTLTVGSANLKKLTNVYVKTIDITDEMRAEDEFIDQKVPFVVCESTDEGAMSIKNYALEKNWTIK